MRCSAANQHTTTSREQGATGLRVLAPVNAARRTSTTVAVGEKQAVLEGTETNGF